jgi:hypothetical protein
LFGSVREITTSANTPVKLLHRRAHGLFQVSVEMLLHQVRDDFGVGLGLELVAFRLQLLLQAR